MIEYSLYPSLDRFIAFSSDLVAEERQFRFAEPILTEIDYYSVVG